MYIKKCSADVQKIGEIWKKTVFLLVFWAYTKKANEHIQKTIYFGCGERKKSYTSKFTCGTRVICHTLLFNDKSRCVQRRSAWGIKIFTQR